MNINTLIKKLAAAEEPINNDKGALFNNFEKNKNGGSLEAVINNKLKQKNPAQFSKILLERLKAKVGLNKSAKTLEEPNIDLSKRPKVKLPDGRIGTILSKGFNIDGKEVLIPTIVNGKHVSDKEAIDHYIKTKEHLGIYDSPEEATTAGKKLHDLEEKRISK
jgi:hypothetical protein